MARARRVALVTGAGGGIGASVCRQFAASGHTVIGADLDPAVRETVASMSGSGHLALVGDVSDEAWVRDAVATAGAVDILVNNAAISPKHDGRKLQALDMPLAEWEAVLGVNLTGAFLMCRACAPGMRERGWGRIINISSQAGRVRADFAGSHYAASKAGLIGFSRVLAGELGGTGITVNCVAPGRVETRMGVVGGPEAMAAYVGATPAGRMGRPDDIASTVAFLASDAAEFITGATLDVNGGYSMG